MQLVRATELTDPVEGLPHHRLHGAAAGGAGLRLDEARQGRPLSLRLVRDRGGPHGHRRRDDRHSVHVLKDIDTEVASRDTLFLGKTSAKSGVFYFHKLIDATVVEIQRICTRASSLPYIDHDVSGLVDGHANGGLELAPRHSVGPHGRRVATPCLVLKVL